MFIDDSSLSNFENFWPLDIYSFKAEVELQLGKKIKVVKSDRGGYYGRYDIRCNVWSPLYVFFNNCEIVLQYIMLGKHTMDKVAE